jgi:hypothetical protein
MIPPPPQLSGIAAKMLALYVEWHTILSHHIKKPLRYSLGIRIDALFAEVIETIALAQFSPVENRVFYITRAIGKNDALKFMLFAIHELKGIEATQFISLSTKAEEIGRMLYGWKNQTTKKLETDKNPK